MRKLTVFNSVTLDGYFTDASGDMSWAHKQDPEWNEFTMGNAESGGELLFGRVTYDMMKSFWPTPAAAQIAPVVADRMNNLPKAVFSRTMDEPTWNNTRLIKDDIAASVRRMKDESGDQMVIMGSGSIVAQLAAENLIDEYQIVLNPMALGVGRTMFDGIKAKLNLRLMSTRAFSDGNVLLCYESLC